MSGLILWVQIKSVEVSKHDPALQVQYCTNMARLNR
jgi:hypothetical protein